MNDIERRDMFLEMMGSSIDWPHWPILPMKRSLTPGQPVDPDRPETWTTGIMVAWYDNLTTIFYANMFMLPSGTFAEVFGPLPQKKYTDHEAILDDGWVID
jgi:hypothetical protein